MSGGRPAFSSTRSATVALVWLALAAGVGVLFFHSHERALRLHAETKLGETLKRNGELEDALSRAVQEKTEIQTRLQDAQDRLTTLSEKFLKLNDQLALMRQHRRKAWMSYRTTVLRRRSLELELKQKDEQIHRILGDLDALMAGRKIDLGSVVVQNAHSGEPPAEVPGGPAGKVVVVNEASEFVVVDLGTKQGVQKGSELLISHGTDPLGAAKVEMAENALSAAGVSKAAAKKIRVGDAVRVMQL